MKTNLYIISFAKPDEAGARLIHMRAFSVRDAVLMAVAQRLRLGLDEALTGVFVCRSEASALPDINNPADWQALPLPTSINLEHATTFSR